jgi:hypothetical protein
LPRNFCCIFKALSIVLSFKQCYGEAFNTLATGLIAARPAEEQVRFAKAQPCVHSIIK